LQSAVAFLGQPIPDDDGLKSFVNNLYLFNRVSNSLFPYRRLHRILNELLFFSALHIIFKTFLRRKKTYFLTFLD